MKIELLSLTVLTLFFFFAWLPTSIAKKIAYGRSYLLSNREAKDLPPLPEWGERSNRAYENLKSYFPAFVVAVLILAHLQVSNDLTQVSCVAFALSRLAHFALYAFGYVTGRASAWCVSIIANTALLIQILWVLTA